MALSADLEYESLGPTETVTVLAGPADILYKGAMLCFDTNGYAAVPTNGAGELNLGICKKKVIALGSHAETVEIETGRFWIAHGSAAQTDLGLLAYPTADDTLAHATATASALGLIIGFKTDYLLVDTRIKAIA